MKPLSAIWIWLVAAALGAVAGFFTASFTTGSIQSDIQAVVNRTLPLTSTNQPAAGTVSGDWRKVSPAVATFYAAKSGAFVERSEDAVARGVVLTSDGWLLALPSPGIDLSRLTVSVDGMAYSVDRVVTDAATGAAFVKITAGNLSVAAFASGNELGSGASAFVLPAPDRVLPATISGTDDGSDLAVSSEVIRTRYALDIMASKAEAGSALVNDRGELIGILDASTDARARAVPLPFILPAFSSLLKIGAIARPSFGLTTIDLARARRLDPTLARGHDTGALVSAVKPGSPAAIAGVLAGDIILEVDGSPIDTTQSLAQALAPSVKGDVRVLTVDRAGTRRAISIQL